MDVDYEQSITRLIGDLKAGQNSALDQLWHVYFDEIVRLARRRMVQSPRRVSDEEDVAVSVFRCLTDAAQPCPSVVTVKRFMVATLIASAEGKPRSVWPKDSPPAYHFANCTGLFTVIGSELSIDRARELFANTLRLRYGSTSGFVVLVIEELEKISKECQVFFKTKLETQLPRNVIVIATSNDRSGLSKALLQRFRCYHFTGSLSLLQAATPYLRKVWEAESPGTTLPECAATWGWDGEEYSLRSALDAMQDYLDLCCV